MIRSYLSFQMVALTGLDTRCRMPSRFSGFRHFGVSTLT
jgi:hypothetical protein